MSIISQGRDPCFAPIPVCSYKYQREYVLIVLPCKHLLLLLHASCFCFISQPCTHSKIVALYTSSPHYLFSSLACFHRQHVTPRHMKREYLYADRAHFHMLISMAYTRTCPSHGCHLFASPTPYLMALVKAMQALKMYIIIGENSCENSCCPIINDCGLAYTTIDWDRSQVFISRSSVVLLKQGWGMFEMAASIHCVTVCNQPPRLKMNVVMLKRVVDND